MRTRILLLLPGILVLVAFLAYRATLAARRRNPFPPGLPGDPSASGLRWTVTNVANSLDVTLKCNCGFEQKFHAEPEPAGWGSNPSPGAGAAAGSDPVPFGDSWNCPQCGILHDLTELHKVIRRSTRSS